MWVSSGVSVRSYSQLTRFSRFNAEEDDLGYYIHFFEGLCDVDCTLWDGFDDESGFFTVCAITASRATGVVDIQLGDSMNAVARSIMVRVDIEFLNIVLCMWHRKDPYATKKLKSISRVIAEPDYSSVYRFCAVCWKHWRWPNDRVSPRPIKLFHHVFDDVLVGFCHHAEQWYSKPLPQGWALVGTRHVKPTLC
jgi:hypothetical protein